MQPHEVKIIRISPLKGAFMNNSLTGEEIEATIGSLGKVGWKLTSTEVVNVGGSSKWMYLFFSRPSQRLEEMV